LRNILPYAAVARRTTIFEELKALVSLAEGRSMERAARGLRLTPSAFSRRIQRLEGKLGSTLLDRHFKPPRLTPAGLEVLERSRAFCPR